jgi:hypothetical protein
MPTFTKAEWDQLLSQVGNGNPDAPLWFLGMEEGLDEKRICLECNLRWRLDQFKQPFDTLTNHFLAPWMMDTEGRPKSPRTSTWRIMAKIARYSAGAEDWQSTPKANDYVLKCLGTATGQTLLLELLPLPKRCHEHWPAIYDERFPGDITKYWSEMLDDHPNRIDRLRSLAREHKPKRVICYGSGNWYQYKRIFQRCEWTQYKLGPRVRAEIGKIEGTTIVLSPFFSHRALSNDALSALCDLLQPAQVLD